MADEAASNRLGFAYRRAHLLNHLFVESDRGTCLNDIAAAGAEPESAKSLVRFAPMTSARPSLTFSLRALFVTLTIGCVWLGWAIERAKKRGKAIDAIKAAGGDGSLFISYEIEHAERTREYGLVTFSYTEPGENHLWLDLKGVPVSVELYDGLNPTVRSLLPHVNGIKFIRSWKKLGNADDSFLRGLANAEEVYPVPRAEMCEFESLKWPRH